MHASAGCVAILLDGDAARLAELLAGVRNVSVQAAWVLSLTHAGERAIPRRYLTAGKPSLARAAALGVVVAEGLAAVTDELNQRLAGGLAAADPGEALMPWFADAPASLVLRLVETGSAGLREAAVDAVLERARRGTMPGDELKGGAALFFPRSSIPHYPDPLFEELVAAGKAADRDGRQPLARPLARRSAGDRNGPGEAPGRGRPG